MEADVQGTRRESWSIQRTRDSFNIRIIDLYRKVKD